ncbi:MAG: hypothetical protein AB8B63_24770 [Granulosicoccus sp.]
MIWPGRTFLLIWLGVFVLHSSLLASETEPASVLMMNPERQVNYTLGDLIEQRVKLSGEDYMFTLTGKPPLRREGPWVERIQSEIDEAQQWLTVTYQIINTPQISRWISLPALALTSENNESLSTPRWEFSVSPLIAVPESENTPFLQADILMPVRATGPLSGMRLKLVFSLLALLVSWALWWYWQNQRDCKRLPFTRCFQQDMKQQDTAASDDNWRSLHRAFDETAGQSINESNLDVLFTKAPWLKALEAEITAFYRQSATHFYSLKHQTPSFDQYKLSQQLFKLERRNLGLASYSGQQLA